MRRMKRLPITFIALVALFGVINCMVIEPALAQLDSRHTEFAGEENGHCDFICHSSHHLWNVDSSDAAINQSLQSLGSITLTFTEEPDPPLSSIFHPPAVI